MTFYIALYSEAGANLAPRDNVMETPLRLHPRNQCHFLLVAAWRGREGGREGGRRGRGERERGNEVPLQIQHYMYSGCSHLIQYGGKEEVLTSSC